MVLKPSQIKLPKKHSVVETVEKAAWSWKEAPHAPLIRTINDNNGTFNISPSKNQPKLYSRARNYARPTGPVQGIFHLDKANLKYEMVNSNEAIKLFHTL